MGWGVGLRQHGEGKVGDREVMNEVCRLPTSESFHPHRAHQARHQESISLGCNCTFQAAKSRLKISV